MADVRPHLRIVSGASETGSISSENEGPAGRELDWSILMARAQEGDSDAYRRLLEEITPFLRILAGHCHRNPSDTEDAVQDILITLHRVRITYDPLRPFGPWLVAIANRRLIDQVRRKVRQRRREAPLGPEHVEFADPASSIEDVAERYRLQAAIDQLPAGQQKAIRLLKLDELSLKEASAASGLSISALKVATHRALKGLRAALTKGNEP